MNFWDILFGTLKTIMWILKIGFFPALIIFGLVYKFRGFISFRWIPRVKEVSPPGGGEKIAKEYLDYELEFTPLFEGDKITELSTLEVLIIFIAILIIMKRFNI
tara:strand:+ start:472 stop:783 length:312 start_codon:yes stop_codon:yes gene_type:complete